MLTKYGGWAAFLASVAVVFLAASAVAAAPLPTYACFTPKNAGLIGRLGPNDASVHAAFEAGACLALPAGIAVTNAQHSGGMWQFRTLGGMPTLYAADWAAGFTGSGDDRMMAAFGRYLPVTGRLLETGYAYADCYDASERLSERWRDLDRRWQEFQTYGSSPFTRNANKVIIYVGDTLPKMVKEGEALRAEGRALDSRCAPYEAVVTDRDFIAFVRSARHSA
ncbi:MAG: hypothetical protein GC190_08520 [Alphaproteobacteria bacterium]|nr:hypothetical protein [Alphaproteobacteria bacterium]